MNIKDKKKIKQKFDEGITNLNTSNFNLALKNFLYVNKFAKNKPEILNLISICYLNLGQYKLAEKFINNAIKKDSNQVGYILNKGNISIDQKNYLKAEKILQNGLIKFSNSSSILYSIGLIKTKQHNFKKAIYFYKKSLRINNSDKFALNNLASALKELGKYKEALIHYEKELLFF